MQNHGSTYLEPIQEIYSDLTLSLVLIDFLEAMLIHRLRLIAYSESIRLGVHSNCDRSNVGHSRLQVILIATLDSYTA